MKKKQAPAMSFLEQLGTGRIVLIIAMLACLAYANSLGGAFVFDDDEQIVENRDVRSWSNLEKAFVTHVWAFREKPDALRVPIPPPYYRPFFTVMLTLEFKLFGLWPQGWHLVSMFLHALISVEVYFLLFALFSRRFEAFLASALFAVYPIHVESVSWISGMTDPLFAISYIPAFYLYIDFRRNGKTRSLVLSVVLFAISAFSKETALSLLMLLFAYEAIEAAFEIKTKKPDRRSLLSRVLPRTKWILPYGAVAAVYLTARYLVLGGLTWYNPHAHKGPFVDTLITLPSIACTYLLHLAWPVNLSAVYETEYVASISSPRFLLPFITLVVLGGLAFRYGSRSKHLCFALALLLIPLLPVLDLRQLSEKYLVSDRYLYLTVAGCTSLIAMAVAKLAIAMEAAKPPRRHLAGAVAVLLVLGLTAVTANENRSWQDSYSLWSKASRVRPGAWTTHYNTGLSLIEMERFEEAREVLMTASRLAPDEPVVFDALGRTYDRLGERAKAEESFKHAIRLDPFFFESFNNLGTIYFRAGRLETAEQYFQGALKLKPQATAARYNLALCYRDAGRYAEAVRELEKVMQTNPSDAVARYELGIAYEKSGRVPDAIRTLRQALETSELDTLSEKIREELNRLEGASRS